MGFGLYLHIPYCLAKCRYCDFYSAGASRGVPDEYVDSLIARIKAMCPGRPETVYFGGGTPSLLSPAQVCLLKAAGPLPGAEITLEANPETVDEKKLAGFRAAGVNRLSLGVQTADDASLARLGRPHTAAQSKAALAAARAAGFENITGDIMLALPHYTREEFDRTLALLAEGGAAHISAYLLKIEPGTPFGKNPPPGLPGEDEAADFYLYAVEELAKAGYAQYEISNFAKPGFEGLHNLIYWDCRDYLGLGPAAASCMEGKRFSFGRSTADFLAGAAPVPEGECTGSDYIMLRLRLAEGLRLSLLKERYGLAFDEGRLAFIRRCVAAGYAVFDGDRLALTPEGMLVQNSILTELLP
ncbi:radical SAM family heme chaperone HemW [Allofournierella sp.]|uniref:radical SAM family heme chaperone HemW n=1 Tax=Allofournierella sp. TaxID=1940256 RepID=UPI002E78E985|nr:radical SAM family heme chaperone HemW [Fournierella sp.]MEE0757809.1 radical SAM family heme chaperone HemW [Fournierella sp.]